jgi:CRISPR-associated protein Cmr6
MPLPLPEAIRKNIEFEKLQTPNLSLRYYKLADMYQSGFDETKKDRSVFFRAVQGFSARQEYSLAFATRQKHLELIGTVFTLTAAKRLLFGVGYSHPLEIGFTFDWTTGLPIIPGSSLKGVARNFAEENKQRCQVDDALIDKVFGPENGEHAGQIIFFPAHPCLEAEQEFLDLDVMTPHYAPYYQKPQENPPADWYNPVPLHFLTVRAGIKYCFRLADRFNHGWKEVDSPILKTAKQLLKSALIEQGVGAKTSVDYGYFRE